jgi:release factor glutamine methyltransferase
MAAAGSVGEALSSAADALRAAGVDSPRLDAEILLEAATGRDRASLAASPEAVVEAAQGRAFGAMVRRRVAREPIAYILGRKGFWTIELETDPRVLVPRPETELLVELAVELRPAAVLDVGTGSGAVALAVATELLDCDVVATDVSRAALDVAATNAARLGLDGRVRFELGTIPGCGRFDLLLANLPYVRSGDWPALAPEITEHEPREALVAGEDGLAAIRSLVAALARGESAGDRPPARTVGLEVGEGQARPVAELLAAAGFAEIEIRPDLAGIERCVVGHIEAAA